MKRLFLLCLLAMLLGRSALAAPAAPPDSCARQVVTNPFWSNWYLQFGLDMQLMLPYGHDLSKALTKGRTMGLDVAAGKWFTPEVGLRARLKWENGFPLFKNKSLEWMAPWGKPNRNIDDGGCVAAYLDVPISVNNIFRGYSYARKWNVIVFPRAGIISNFSAKSCSPLVGFGAGATYRINHRWSIYGDVGFQMTTSEFIGGEAMTGMEVSTGFNSHIDFHIGAQLDLGRCQANKFTPIY